MAKPWNIVDFDPKEKLIPAVVKIARARFQQMMSYEEATLKGEDIEALHDMRVSARRLRAVLRIFGDCFPRKKLRKQEKILEDLTRLLGLVREHDVFIEQLQTYRKTLSESEAKIIDLLLAREEIARKHYRKSLVKEIRQLNRRNFGSSFEKFLLSS